MIANVYGDPDTDIAAHATMMRLNQKLEHTMQAHIIDHYIVAGDFNIVLQRSDSATTSRKPQAEGALLTLINNFDLFDVAALISPNPKHTYYRARRENTSARYDRFYVDQNLMPNIKFKHLRRTTDHTPIQIEIQKQDGSPNWKFSDMLLTSTTFLQGLHDQIRKTMGEFTDDADVLLTELQNRIDYSQHPAEQIFNKLIEDIRKYCMSQTKILRQKKIEHENQVIQELIQTRDALNSTQPPTQEAVNNYEKAQEKYTLYQAKRHQTASERNLINYATMGERCSRYHFARSNRGKPSREIPRLLIEENGGQRVLEGMDLRQHMYEKYRKLVQPDTNAGNMTIEQFLGPDLMQSLRKCPEDQYNMLTGPILYR